MNYSLSELLDLPKLKDLLDSLNAVQQLPSAIVDIKGNILTATNWQDICVKFHRLNPQTKKKCLESDLHIEASLDHLKACTIYRCPMGLIDAAVPIIIEGNHLGNIYSGQLFLEPPDEDYFRKQAQKYDFNEKNYLKALQKVPLFSEEQLRNNLTMIHHLVQGLVEQGLQFKHQLEAENKLRQSKEKYQRIFENLQEVYYEANLQGKLLEISPSIQAISQYTREELIGKSLKDLYVDSNAREHFVDRLLSTGRVKNYPIHLRDKDGTQRYCAITTSLLKDSRGVPVKLIGSIRDMSENEQISEQLQLQIKEHETSQKLLKESEERFKALHEASFGGVGIHDKGLILDCNQGLSDITGFSIAELIGMQGLQLIAPDYLDQVLHNIKSAATDRYEVEGVRKDGSIYPLSIKGKTVQYKGREARVIEFRDITEIKRAETELRKSESTQRAMLENIIDVIMIIDQQGINRFKSANIEKWFGWKPTELIGEPVWNRIHPEDLTSVKKSIATIMNEPDTVKTGECRYLCRNGEYKWI
ncbi:MAG: PAS domain S-box protein [Geopsychrobacter sp.]|nr:PAS domain S-box protein [Geopsychrobacter sp.]